MDVCYTAVMSDCHGSLMSRITNINTVQIIFVLGSVKRQTQ